MKNLFLLIFLTISNFSIAQNTGENNLLLAESYYQQGQYKKAIQLYKKLYEKSPFNNNYLYKLISCYQETNQFLAVEDMLKIRMKNNHSQPYLFVFLGYNYERQKQTEKAKINYKKALNTIDKNPIYGGLIGNLFRQYNLLNNAILAYKKTMLKNPNADYNLQIGKLYGEKGNFKKMFEAYINLVDKNNFYLRLVQRDLSKYITENAENENNVLFRKTLLKKSASNPKKIWNLLLGWLFTQQKEYDKAFVQEKALYQRNPSNLYSIFSLAKIAFQAKDYHAAKTCFNFIKEKSISKEEQIDANVYLIKIEIASKNPNAENLFQSLFKKFGKNTSTIKLQVEYADFLTFEKNEPKKAIKVLETALKYANSKFDGARIKLKLGDILVFIGKYNKALIYFSQIQTELKNHELAQQARFKVAQTSYFKGDFSWAKTQLKILKSSTTQLIANDAVKLFLTISENEPVDSIPSGLKQYAKADLLAFQNKNQQAIELLTLIDEKFKGQPIEDEALFKQAKLFIKQKEFTKAISNLKKIITLNPKGILIDDAYYELAELYNYPLKDSKKALKYYQKIIFEYPSSIYLAEARKKYRKLRGDKIN